MYPSSNSLVSARIDVVELILASALGLQVSAFKAVMAAIA